MGKVILTLLVLRSFASGLSHASSIDHEVTHLFEYARKLHQFGIADGEQIDSADFLGEEIFYLMNGNS